MQASAELQAIDDERACAMVLARSIERLFPLQDFAVLIWPEESVDPDDPLIHPLDSTIAARSRS